VFAAGRRRAVSDGLMEDFEIGTGDVVDSSSLSPHELMIGFFERCSL
jgi:hypothetical protein